MGSVLAKAGPADRLQRSGTSFQGTPSGIHDLCRDPVGSLKERSSSRKDL